MGLSSNFCKEETVRGWLYAVAFCTTKYLSEGCLHCKDCRISRGEIQKERKGIKDSRCSEKIPLKGEAIETKKSRRELKTQAHKNQALSKRTGQIIPERRFVEAINRQPYQYEMGDFPTEWEAWIRKKRKDPPTIEKKKNFMESERLLGVMVHSELQDYWYLQFHKEILRNENYREEMKQKVKDVLEKDKLLQAKEYKEGLVAEPAHTHVEGHASAPYYGKKEPSPDPTSTASTFQPGSWMPPGSGGSHKK
ncbi:NADH dehydrogenase [ubiquinone] 1 alpha subcomplex assembly factor 2 isoform X2 [Cuculus canorus]|uniref:NADH dehydrogenase [ubiquinone] 1 alpha subcomplex assembly factor 2 isoform X2 n=1 Tax=Cuculus canorus TaxID=55661 RepID=UPI0023AA3B22|nr:NADH dehydrogenase [ubiquinone] 1 alpha subcomplex assembly factor 2 isoform X2 [Cuculus canorus]